MTGQNLITLIYFTQHFKAAIQGMNKTKWLAAIDAHGAGSTEASEARKECELSALAGLWEDACLATNYFEQLLNAVGEHSGYGSEDYQSLSRIVGAM